MKILEKISFALIFVLVGLLIGYFLFNKPDENLSVYFTDNNKEKQFDSLLIVGKSQIGWISQGQLERIISSYNHSVRDSIEYRYIEKEKTVYDTITIVKDSIIFYSADTTFSIYKQFNINSVKGNISLEEEIKQKYIPANIGSNFGLLNPEGSFITTIKLNKFDVNIEPIKKKRISLSVFTGYTPQGFTAGIGLSYKLLDIY